MIEKIRFKRLETLNRKARQTEVCYVPQVLISGEWCYIKDKTTALGVEQYETMEEAQAAVERLRAEETELQEQVEYERLNTKYEK